MNIGLGARKQAQGRLSVAELTRTVQAPRTRSTGTQVWLFLFAYLLFLTYSWGFSAVAFLCFKSPCPTVTKHVVKLEVIR